MSPPARDGAGPRDIIHIVDDNLRKGFAQMPRPVLRARGLSVKAKLVYVLLLDYAWQDDSCFPGQDTMATDLDVSTDTVQRALKELRAYQLVDWKQLGLNRPNVYYILRLSECPHLDLGGNRNLRLPETARLRHPETATSGTNNTQETIPNLSKAAAQPNSDDQGSYPSKFRKGPHLPSGEETTVAPGKGAPAAFVPALPEGPGPVTRSAAASNVSETGMARLSQVLATHGIPVQRARQPSSADTSRVRQEPVGRAVAPPSTTSAVPSVPKADQDTIRTYLTQYAEEFHDQAPKFSSSMTRVLHYFEASGALLGPFTARMEAARRRTKADQSAGRIRKKGSPFAYFLSLLEEELGLREAPAAFKQHVATPAALAPPERKSLAGKYAKMVRR